MPEGHGAPAPPQAARSAADRPSGPARPGAPVQAGVPQKLAEALSSQHGLNVFVAGLLLLLAWAVHASGVGKSALLCFLSALMLLQLLWMLWYLRRRAAHRRLLRLKDTHAGARWLRGECPFLPPLPPRTLLGLCLPARLFRLSPFFGKPE
ncbi:Otopetrin-1 [Pteropus alecto]|uniref:Otopetrin-1 n=1 Tax=Pteropus alecto TaxID=9402 RepID=L5K4M8_PTEAL|nr:Otopetrin-1 [Pteropus alecto]